MKSIVYNSKSVSGITQIQYCISPELKHSQLIVQVKSVSLNPVDAKFIIFDKLPKFTHNYLTPLIDNRIVGFDFAGVVSSSKSIHYKPGDRVFGITSSGSLSNEIIVPDSQVSLMPSTSTFSEAAALPLVIGASGGTGLSAIQIGKSKGAHVVGISSIKNSKIVLDSGADLVFDYNDLEMISKIQEFVGINGKFDVIMDCVSSGHEIDSCHLYESKLKQFVIDSGSYLIIGGFTSDWIAAGIKRLTGLNLFSKGRELIWIKFENTSNDLANIARLFDQGAIKSRIFRHVEFSSDGIKEAFELLKGRRTVGKIVVDVEGS